MADPLGEEKISVLGQTCTPWYDPALQRTSFIPDFSGVTDVDEFVMEEIYHDDLGFSRAEFWDEADKLIDERQARRAAAENLAQKLAEEQLLDEADLKTNGDSTQVEQQ